MLHRLVSHIREHTSERVVLVSNYTRTLDMLGHMARLAGWPALRLDGTTSGAARQGLVDRFNDSRQDCCKRRVPAAPDRAPPLGSFVLALDQGRRRWPESGGRQSPAAVRQRLESGARRAGHGARVARRAAPTSGDLSPAVDGQAVCRVGLHALNRVARQGTIEEKIYQRQLSKLSLSKAIVDGGAGGGGKRGGSQFTREELRKIFVFNDATQCDTHDVSGLILVGWRVSRGCMQLTGCLCAEPDGGASMSTVRKAMKAKQQKVARRAWRRGVIFCADVGRCVAHDALPKRRSNTGECVAIWRWC